MSAATTPVTNAPVRGRRRWVTLAVVGAFTLGACGGEAKDDADADASSPAPSGSASVETPDEVEVTAPGTQLRFGEGATVDYRIREQGTILELAVQSASQGAVKDFAGFNLRTPYERNANYYYVQVTAKNVGEAPLNGVDVPLWGISGDNTLLPPVVFKSSFAKCQTAPTPAKFGPGKTHKTCLVLLSPNKGTLEGISYRPDVAFDPIEWRGQVKAPVTRAAKKKPAKKKPAQPGNG